MQHLIPESLREHLPGRRGCLWKGSPRRGRWEELTVMVVTLMLPRAVVTRPCPQGLTTHLPSFTFFIYLFVIVYKTKFLNLTIFKCTVLWQRVQLQCRAASSRPSSPPERKPRTHDVVSPPSLLPAAPACRLWICLLRAFHRGGAIVCGLCVWLLPLCRMSSGSLHAVTRGWLTPLYGWVIFHHVMDHISFTHTSICGRLGCFHLLAVCEKCAANIWMQVTN